MQRVDGLLEGYLVGFFIAGLRDEIRLDVKVKKLCTLFETIGFAHLIEERNQLQWKTGPYSCFLVILSPSMTGPNPSSGLLGPPPTPKSGFPAPLTTVQQITRQEAMECREKL